MINVGFLGCAHLHADHYCAELEAPGLAARPVAVYDRESGRAREFADPRGLRVASSARRLCSMVDAVIVTSEHVHYPDMVAAAASADVPVLCEKPLGISVEAAAVLLHSGAWVSVAFPVRYALPVAQAKAMIEGNVLGSLLAMSGVNHAAFPGRFFGDRASAGGGALIDHVVHLADALRWLTGCEYATVYAEASSLRAVGDVEDAAQVTATTSDGAWASIDPSWSRPQGMAGDNDFAMTMWFENGQINVDAFARHGQLVGESGRVSHLPYGVEMNTAMLADWLRAIEVGDPPPIPMGDGWKATELALAALESARTGLVVKVGAEGTP